MFKKKRVYVAGKWEDRKIIREIQEEIISMGHVITCDWTKHVEPYNLMEYALEDIEGVKQCDFLIAYMMKEYVYKGVWAEIGAALALKKSVLVIGDKGDSGIFINHPLVTRVNTLRGGMKVAKTM